MARRQTAQVVAVSQATRSLQAPSAFDSEKAGMVSSHFNG